MTTRELRQRIWATKTGPGHWKVTAEYRGKEYAITTTNSMAVDAAFDDYYSIQKDSYYISQKQALNALYCEVKRYHDLGEYKLRH